MNNLGQYYEILGLKPGVSLAEIKQAYRNLAMNWHPDRYPNDPQLQQKAHEEIKIINEAYNFLKSYEAVSQNRSSFLDKPSSNLVDMEAYYKVIVFLCLLSWLTVVTLYNP
jgi:preprotein translocase subunit Sec63